MMRRKAIWLAFPSEKKDRKHTPVVLTLLFFEHFREILPVRVVIIDQISPAEKGIPYVIISVLYD